MRFKAGKAGTKLALLTGSGAASRAANSKNLFWRGFHRRIMNQSSVREMVDIEHFFRLRRLRFRIGLVLPMLFRLFAAISLRALGLSVASHDADTRPKSMARSCSSFINAYRLTQPLKNIPRTLGTFKNMYGTVLMRSILWGVFYTSLRSTGSRRSCAIR
jgi:hypothetical protein